MTHLLFVLSTLIGMIGASRPSSIQGINVKDEVQSLHEETDSRELVMYDGARAPTNPKDVPKTKWQRFKAYCAECSLCKRLGQVKPETWRRFLNIAVGLTCLVVTLACQACVIAAAAVAFSYAAINAIYDVADKVWSGKHDGYGEIAFAVAKAGVFLVANLASGGVIDLGAFAETAKALTDASIGILDFICDTFVTLTDQDAEAATKDNAAENVATSGDILEQKSGEKEIGNKALVFKNGDQDVKDLCETMGIPDAKQCTLKLEGGGPVKKYFKCVVAVACG